MTQNVSSVSSDLTLYFLQASRSIRVAWLLEELGLPYKSIFYPREKNKAPASFKSDSGNTLAKAPALKDGDLLLAESGAISEYLVETYEPSQAHMGGSSLKDRAKIRQMIHAAEGIFMCHCIPITYARWFSPERVKESGDLKTIEEGMSGNVIKDMDWLESELMNSTGKFLVGNEVTAADTMMLFSIQFIFARDLINGHKISEWSGIEKWVKQCESTETWKRACEYTGHDITKP